MSNSYSGQYRCVNVHRPDMMLLFSGDSCVHFRLYKTYTGRNTVSVSSTYTRLLCLSLMWLWCWGCVQQVA